MIVLQPTPFGCAAAVVAMITGDDIELVFAAIGHRCETRGMRFLEIVSYLASRGLHIGAYSGCRKPDRMIRFKWSRGIPAYLVVASQSGAGAHAVYWDGRRVLDPEQANAGRELADYTVLEWWPILIIEDTEIVQG